MAKRSLLRFDIHLADHCNLKCKSCLHFSPLAPEVFQDITVLERDCKRLAELTGGRVEDICVLGGEPLLHPRITDCLDIARKYFPEDRIYIVTNGILLLKQPEEFWQNCVKNNIGIDISLYPIHLDLEKIKQTAMRHDIKIAFRGRPKVQRRGWSRQTLDLEGKQNAEESHRICELANFCIQLVDGKLYQCETAAFVKYFNKYFHKNLEITEKDYVGIHQEKSLDEILEFLCKPTPFCRYCNTAEVDCVEWEHSKEEISEWV
ncbi:MAG: radical SAM protein [Dysgonamonadaceae bacterium]|nr:radical SAM protein [Dysgonamonadaceae bacterium]